MELFTDWRFLMTLATIVIWAIRLEAMAKSNRASIDNQTTQLANLLAFQSKYSERIENNSVLLQEIRFEFKDSVKQRNDGIARIWTELELRGNVATELSAKQVEHQRRLDQLDRKIFNGSA